jgi:predicted transposase/invertase (TIGR01784 family)
MAELSNPHDRVFKRVFSQPDAARDFLHHYLPASVAAALDLSTLTLHPDSFIDADLQQQFSDLLYQTRLAAGGEGFVYLLFEHKSYPDKFVAFQLLRYMVRIWEKTLLERTHALLPPILPLVFYHGLTSWQLSPQLGALVAGPEALRAYVPDFRYQLYDLSAYSAEEIKGSVVVQACLLLWKYVLTPELGERLPSICVCWRN